MSKKTRKRRSAAELQTITNRLFYEWQMIASLAYALEKADLDDQMLINAFIESCALHARVVMKFLYAHQERASPRSDDAVAEDFFINSVDWHNKCPTLPNALEYEAFGIFANKQIAHIVYPNARSEQFIAQGHKEWNFTEIADAIQPALEKFVYLVKPEHLGERWWNLLNDQKGYRWEELKNLITAKNA